MIKINDLPDKISPILVKTSCSQGHKLHQHHLGCEFIAIEDIAIVV